MTADPSPSPASPVRPVSAVATLAALAARERSTVELVDELLARIETQADLGCFWHVDADGARAAALAADTARAAGDDRPLLGLPIAVKDLLDVAGMPTTAGARAWVHEARGDAASVGALRAAGAIVLGKAATNEWAFGIDGVNPWRAPCRNPHDPERLPGGSSSGPAVAIAAGLALGGVGSDTSGSLRVPAALCGIASLRPTPGRVPLDGALSLAPSYDVVGPMGATPADVALLLAAMAGPAPVAPATRSAGAAAGRVAVIANLTDPADPEVAARVRAAGAALGADEIALPELDDALAVHASVQLYEAARIHAGRGGPLSNLAPEVAARIEAGGWIDDAAYLAGRARRAEIARAILAALARYDVLLAPTAPIVAPHRDAPDMRTPLLSCVVPLTQAPVPVASVALPGPGLPIGAQLVGRPGADEALLEVAARLA